MPAEPEPAPIHLKPAAPLAERVLLPGDPHRALRVAEALLERPRMFNHHRGLWGYTGTAPDGQSLTVQATGMGGPSAAIVAEELIDLGARTLVRIGTCGALDPALRLGDVVTASEVIPADGASAALGAGERLRPDPALTAALSATGDHAGPVVSSDLFYDRRPGLIDRWRAAGAIAVEMEAAAVLRVAELRGAAAACMLAVSDVVRPAAEAPPAGEGAPERERAPVGTAMPASSPAPSAAPARSEPAGPRPSRVRLDREQVELAGRRLGEVAFAALARAPRAALSGGPATAGGSGPTARWER